MSTPVRNNHYPINDTVINSFSSGLMLGTTLYRNKGGAGCKVIALAGYPLIAVAAVVETIVSTIFVAASLVFYPISNRPLNGSLTWLSSSSFCFFWSAADFLLSLFSCPVLVADEASARQIVSSGNLLMLPRNALLGIHWP
jgi:hypothetical protein